MFFPKANGFDRALVMSKIMGPNPLKLEEELMHIANEATGCDAAIAPSSVTADLGSGTGITSVMLAREYGLCTYAVDLWSDPEENTRFFEEMDLCSGQIVSVKADVTDSLPFEDEFFDAVVSVDSYNYFGREQRFLDEKLLPYVKSGGLIAIAVPGMKRDCHEDLPPCLLESWTPEQLDYMHDISWWRSILEQAEGAEVLAIREMTCTKEAWADWLACDNDYARGDRAAVEAGALEHLNSIAIVMRKR